MANTPKTGVEAETKKYRRGQQNKLRGIGDKKQKAKLKRTEELFENVSGSDTYVVANSEPTVSSNCEQHPVGSSIRSVRTGN